MSRKKTLANGKLRPAARRYKAKRARAQRKAWLANFKPGDRDRFFDHVDVAEAIFLRPFERATGLDRAAAAQTLEHIANDRGWRKLRTLDRTVVGIAPPKTKQQPKERDGGTGDRC